jgi:hypothetical protein
MRIYPLYFFALFGCVIATVYADVLSLDAENAQQRMQENPDIYDRVDDFCRDRKPQMACTISGSTFSGGGTGTCVREYSGKSKTIDLYCVRTSEVLIDRQLPDNRFVDDEDLCSTNWDDCGKFGTVHNGVECKSPWNCTPLTPTPHDQFCKGKVVGNQCTVVLNYLGKEERHQGLCKTTIETDTFYHRGYHTRTSRVINCEPPSEAPRNFTTVKWFNKLLPKD